MVTTGSVAVGADWVALGGVSVIPVARADCGAGGVSTVPGGVSTVPAKAYKPSMSVNTTAMLSFRKVLMVFLLKVRLKIQTGGYHSRRKDYYQLKERALSHALNKRNPT